MLLMIEKPRATPSERALLFLRRAPGAALRGLHGLVMGPFRAAENRRLVGALAAMSDHELRDIGLGRGDIRDAVALPSGSDGTLFLATRRAERRRFRR